LLSEAIEVYLKAPPNVQSEKQAVEFLVSANTAGVLSGYFIGGLIDGKPRVISRDYGVLEPTPTEFIYILNVQISEDEYEVVENESVTSDIDMDERNV